MSRRDRSRSRSTRSERQGLSRWLGPVPLWVVLGALSGAVAVVAVATANTLSEPGRADSGPTGGPNEAPRIRYDVGQPGVGQEAPDFPLGTADGNSFRLSERRGTNVLLYFHEGLMCAPCWRQIDDIQADLAKFQAVGVDEIAAISIDPADAQRQRAEIRGVSFAVLADSDLSVSRLYDALSYGMMGGTRPGHTFILVGPDGKIRWRADYGGPPDFTMYVPNPTVLAELRRATNEAG